VEYNAFSNAVIYPKDKKDTGNNNAKRKINFSCRPPKKKIPAAPPAAGISTCPLINSSTYQPFNTSTHQLINHKNKSMHFKRFKLKSPRLKMLQEQGQRIQHILLCFNAVVKNNN
jgi:hypothetical protein